MRLGASFSRRLEQEVDDLLAAARNPDRGPIGHSELERLPLPVQRWLAWSRVVDAPVPATVRLRQEGEFRLSERSWKQFEAEQYFSLDPPGFLWHVSMRFAPLLSIHGRDRWRDGDASIEMRLAGLVPVARSRGDRLAQGAMLRWLGETIWFPHAATIGRVTWAATDDACADATIDAGGQRATMSFLFDAEGRPTEQRASRFNDSKNIRWRVRELDFDVPRRF